MSQHGCTLAAHWRALSFGRMPLGGLVGGARAPALCLTAASAWGPAQALAGRRRRVRARAAVPAAARAYASAVAPGLAPARAWQQTGGTISLVANQAGRGRLLKAQARGPTPEASGGYDSGSGSDSDAEEPEVQFGITPSELLREYGCASHEEAGP